ncbi:hypothetical protein PLIP_b0893 [Pseudoalteromonas lipolytica LMEB 39]|nr:hypothetical protein [Pseudoalteromonas lipolytica LMEB 39]
MQKNKIRDRNKNVTIDDFFISIVFKFNFNSQQRTVVSI